MNHRGAIAEPDLTARSITSGGEGSVDYDACFKAPDQAIALARKTNKSK